jgi:putative acetyltransferase
MLRLLELNDMDQVAVVQRRSRDHALPWMKVLHTPEEDRWFFRERVFKMCRLWGYFEDGELAGFIAFREGWIDHLYVVPTSQHRGIGSALLQVAQSKMRSLNLWTFQRNATARRFYEKHRFALIKETDGTGNEENEPDALYTWRSATCPNHRPLEAQGEKFRQRNKFVSCPRV